MSPFFSGVLGALAVLLVLGLARRLRWARRLHRWRAGHPAGLSFLMRRLGARPEQERVIEAEAAALAGEGAALRDDWREARAELAELFSQETLDVAAVSAALDRRLERLARSRQLASEAVARLHAALDPSQRARLVAMLRRGPGGHGCRRQAHA
jgi:Spy/CpxP family protein refolding chaperone